MISTNQKETGMDTRGRNPIQSVAFFEEKVPLTPRDFAEEVNIDNLLFQKLSQKLEGKCSLHGWVVPQSLRILSRSMGYVESGRFTGDIVFHVQVEGTVINPPSGVIVTGQVMRKNKMGMYVDYKGAIRIILPRDLHIGDELYESVEVGQFVECEIKKSRFQVNDEFILSVGDFRGIAEGKGDVRVETIPMGEDVVEEESKEEQEEAEEKKEEQEEQEEKKEEQEEEFIGGQMNLGPVEFGPKSTSFQELSNSYKSRFLLDGKEWPTVEHYVQAQKFTSSPEHQEAIRAAKDASKAKVLGSSKDFPVRNDWDTYQETVMKKALDAKFGQNVALKDILLSTKNRPIVDISTDAYWGQGRNKKGKNRLGLLLMELRDSMSAGKDS